MPEYVYTGPGERVYPEGRDAHGANLGLVGPDDIRDLDGPPDQWWREATDEDRAARAAAAGTGHAQDVEQPGEPAAGAPPSDVTPEPAAEAAPGE